MISAYRIAICSSITLSAACRYMTDPIFGPMVLAARGESAFDRVLPTAAAVPTTPRAPDLLRRLQQLVRDVVQAPASALDLAVAARQSTTGYPGAVAGPFPWVQRTVQVHLPSVARAAAPGQSAPFCRVLNVANTESSGPTALAAVQVVLDVPQPLAHLGGVFGQVTGCRRPSTRRTTIIGRFIGPVSLPARHNARGERGPMAVDLIVDSGGGVVRVRQRLAVCPIWV